MSRINVPVPKGIINSSPIRPLKGIRTTPKTVDTKFITNEIKYLFKYFRLQNQ